MTERVTVIVNPASGRGRGSRLLPDIRKTFAAVGVTDVRLTERPGDEKRLAALALHDGATTIVACGGDGTWSNAANAILSAGSNCRLALLAAGTGNDFAKTVGAPAGDLAATAKLAVEGPEMLVDVGRIEDRYFLNVTGFGFDIAVLDDLKNIPFLTGDLLYLGAALRQLFKFDGMKVDITTAAVARGPRAHLMLIIANGRNFGGMFQIAPDARINDGRSTRSRFSTHRRSRASRCSRRRRAGSTCAIRSCCRSRRASSRSSSPGRPRTRPMASTIRRNRRPSRSPAFPARCA